MADTNKSRSEANVVQVYLDDETNGRLEKYMKRHGIPRGKATVTRMALIKLLEEDEREARKR